MSRPMGSNGSIYSSEAVLELLGGLKVIVWEADAETLRFRFVSSHAEEILGYPIRNWLEESQFWADLIHPDDRDVTVAACKSAIARGEDHALEYRVIAADGRTVWLYDLVHVLTDDSNRTSGVRGVMVDITERKRERERLADSEERFRLAFHNAVTGMLLVDSDGRFIEVNKPMCDMLGYSRDELLQLRRGDLSHPDESDDTIEQARRLFEGEIDSVRLARKLMHKDGHVVWVELGASTVRDVGGKPLCLLVQVVDVTERRRLEEQLHQSQKMEAIGQLAGGVAHDFNNILGVILNCADFLVEETQGNEVARADAEEIRKAADRAAALTRDLLVFSRRDLASPEPLDLNSVIRGVERMLRRTLGEHIRLELDLADELHPVTADLGQFEQVLVNLAVNARDAMPTGGVLSIESRDGVEETTIRPTEGPRDRAGVLLTIGDTGVGMNREVKERAMEPFFTTKPSGLGTGLGLSIVYGIVTKAGGFVEIESEIRKGTKVRIWLPQIEGMEVQAEEPGRHRVSTHRGKGERILVVEDEEAVCRLTARVLSSSGYEVIEAANSGEALAVLETHPESVDLLLTDVVMPQMSGMELLGRLRQRNPKLKVLYMSGYPQQMIAAQGGIDGPLVEKPFTGKGLLEAVDDVFAAPLIG
jgi:two-component system, cell cycle sensor histidine kinase and response regulator CckA